MSSLLRNIEQFSWKFHFPLTARCFSKLFTNGGKTRSLSPVYMRYHGLSKASESWGKTYNEISHTLDNNWIIFRLEVFDSIFQCLISRILTSDLIPNLALESVLHFTCSFITSWFTNIDFTAEVYFSYIWETDIKSFSAADVFNSPFVTKRDKELILRW